MGLDPIELVMTVEDNFAIRVDDDDASRIQTVGQLYHYVLGRVGAPLIVPCPSATGFRRVRRALIDTGVMGRADVRLDTDLIDWSSASPEAWTFFQRSLGLRPIRPPLRETTARLLRRAAGVAALVLLAPFVTMFGRHGVARVQVLLAASSLAAIILIEVHMQPRAPLECGTVRGFVRHHVSALVPHRQAEIWARLVEIVATQAGVNAATIDAQTRLVEDLGL